MSSHRYFYRYCTMPIACPGCERIFSATKNLKTHQKKCQKYDQYLMNIVSQKHALEDDIESSYASAKRARVTASGSADGNVNAASDLFLVSSLMLCAMRPPHGICTQHEEEPGPSSFAPSPPYLQISVWTNHTISLPPL